MTNHPYDLIVLGAGPVGENLADRATRGGLRTVVVESELVGGECSYWACMPSKALLRPGAALRGAMSVAGARSAVTGALDPAEVLRRRDSFTHDWNDESQVEWLSGADIDLVRGVGRIIGHKRVAVTGTDGDVVELTARHAVAICTGSAAHLPDIPGLREVNPWTSREATAVREVPESIAIIGGGVVACEMATVFHDLGSRVTLLARSTLLSSAEPEAAERVTRALSDRGVTVLTDTSPVSVHRAEKNVVISLTDERRVLAAEVLVATGRIPRTGDIGLETVGLSPASWLDVDDTLLVGGTDWLYAAGDVNHRALLTHQGKYQARAAGDVIVARATAASIDDRPWGAHVATADHAVVPQVVFTDPEVAWVGMTAATAAAEGHRVTVVDYDLGSVAGSATFADGYEGWTRAIIDADRQVVIGATFVGPAVAELLHAATIAIVGEVPLDRLWHAVPAYPTMSEVWLRWLEALGRPGD